MQPPPNSKPDVSNQQVTKKHKRKAPNKKKLKSEHKQEPQVKSEVDPTQVSSIQTETEPATRSPGPYRGKCLYQSRKCENERAIKRNGKPHNLCEEHRSKQNQHQRKFDAKKFSRKRRRGSDSEDDDHVKSDEPQKHGRSDNQVEVKAEFHPSATTSMITTMSYSRFNSGILLPRLPPIQSPTEPNLPSSPALVNTNTIMRPSEAYPRGHVVYSEYQRPVDQQTSPINHRPYLQQNPHASQSLPGYSHSELVAASILVHPQQELPPTGCLPRVLPSLRVSPAPPSPFHQVRRLLSPAERFPPLVRTPAGGASNSPSINGAVGNILPPLVPFGLRRSSTSMSFPNASSQNK